MNTRYVVKYELFELRTKGIITDAQMFIAGALLDSLNDDQLESLAPTYADALLQLSSAKPTELEALMIWMG